MALRRKMEDRKYACCDYDYLVGAAHRAESLRRAERARLRQLAGKSAPAYFFAFTLLGKLFVSAGAFLVRLGGARVRDIRAQAA